MSVENEILRIQHNIANAYAAVSGKGGEVPLQPTSANLAAAVESIPSDGDTAYLVKAPVGTIVIWSGTADNIPTGWALCDGQDGRPDLRDKFVLGAGTAHAVGDTGGEETHTLTVEEMPSHIHKIYTVPSAATGNNAPIGGAGTKKDQGAKTESMGGSQPHNNMPPYYALCYIIKVTADETDGPTYTAGDGIDITETEAGASIGVTTPVRSIVTQAEYDALPEAERNKGLYVISDGGSGGGGGGSEDVYSTEETRIGTWIDGKPLYRRAFQVTCPAAGGYAIVIPVASIPNITLWDIRGYLHSNSNSAGGVVNFAYSRAYIATWNYGGSIYMETNNSDYANSPAVVILEYTKTTDEGGTT